MNNRRITQLPGMKPLAPMLCMAVMLLALATGCKAGKSAGKRDSSGAIPAEISLQTPQERYASLCGGYADWTDVAVPVRVALTAPQSLGFSARAVMKHDEWISVSVRMLGFEVASVWIDNDSVHAVDRYHKVYLSESIGKLLAGTDITVGNVQDLLMGRGALAGSNGGVFTIPMEKSLKFTSGPEGLMIFPAVQPAGFEYGYILSTSANNLLAASVTANAAQSAVITYSDFTDTRTAGWFASHAAINVAGAKELSAEIDWNFTSAKWNSGEDRRWSQPKGYRRIPAEQLLRSLTTL